MCGAFVFVNTGIHIPRGVDISRVRFSLSAVLGQVLLQLQLCHFLQGG